MKKILLLISLFACIAASAQLPPIPGTQPRSLPANRPQDYNLWVRNQLGLPLFNDTTQANTNTTMDTCGRVIFTYDVDDFWIRKCSPSKHWERAGSGGFTIIPNCGLQNGTGIVTYDDSTLNFDISSAIFALCCDHVPRVAPFTHVTLDSNTSDNPRIDAIVLTAHGDSVIKGIPDPNPAQPQLTDCQILLTYVTINAHENIPANFTIDPVIYDEVIIPPQWDTLATAVTANFNDGTSPAHLTKDIDVSNITGLSKLTFTSDSTLNFGNYGVLKFYIKLKGAFSSGSNMFQLTWYNDNTPVSFPLVISVGSYGMTNNVNGVYIAISIPISDWQFVTMVGNRLVFSFQKTNATGIYLDWIQLQTGAVSSATFVKSVTMNDLDSLLIPTITNPNSNPLITFTKYTVPPNVVLINNSTSPGQYSWGKIDLSSNLFINTFPTTNITPGPNGTYLATEGGVVQWLPKVVDTTITHNGVYREVNGVNSTDSLSYGYWKRDSAALVYDNTYLGMNSKAFSYQQGATDFWKIASNGFNAFVTQSGSRFEWTTGINVTAANDLTLGNDGNVFTVTGNTQINAITTANWQAGSQIQLIFSGTPTVKNNTAGGAGTATILLAGGVDFAAAANDVLTLVYDGTNWHESARKTNATVSSQTLQQTFNTEVGGSVLTKADTILANHTIRIIDNSIPNATTLFELRTTSAATAQLLNIQGGNLISGGIGINISAGSGTGINATVLGSQNAIQGQSVGGLGISGSSTTNYGGSFSSNSATAAVAPVLKLTGTQTGTAGNGIGTGIDFFAETTTNIVGALSNQIQSIWADATNATRTSQLSITGVNSAVTQTLVTIDGSGAATFLGPSSPSITITAINTTGAGIFASTTSGVGVESGTTTGIPAYFTANPSSTNSVVNVLLLERDVTGTAANGLGQDIRFSLETSNGSGLIANKIISEWTDATTATATSKFTITGMNGAATGNVLVISGDGSTQMPKYGSGAATFDASGNITSVSDVRLKDVQGYYNGGLNELMNVNPIIYKWNEKSGMEMKHDYIGFSAQNIQSALGENAIGINRDGYLSIQDRAILATLTNAIKEQQKEIEYLKSLIK